MNFYPVIIPTLCRYEHLRDCVESLARCKFADCTELIIGLDYPAKESHRPGYEKIKAWLPEITGFRKVTVIERSENFGAVRNVRDLRDYAFERYDAVIQSEDDNVFACGFLQFMDSALTNFASDQSISSICGYTHTKLLDNSADYILSRNSSAWGNGIWKEKCVRVQVNQDYARSILKSFTKTWKIYTFYPALVGMLMAMLKNNDVYGDTLHTANNIIEHRFQINPSESLVNNNGFDGSGLHCADHSMPMPPLSRRTEYIIGPNSKAHEAGRFSLFGFGLSSNPLYALKSVAAIAVRYLLYRLKK